MKGENLANGVLFGFDSDEDETSYAKEIRQKKQTKQQEENKGQKKPSQNQGNKNKSKNVDPEKQEIKDQMRQRKVGKPPKKKKQVDNQLDPEGDSSSQHLLGNGQVNYQSPLLNQNEEIKHQQQNSKKIFQILKEIKDDENFKALINKFDILRQESMESEKIQRIDKEKYYGNIEYKLKLVNCDLGIIQHKTTQMKFRLEEGILKEGYQVAYYMIGVEDDGNALGLQVLEEMMETLGTLFFMARNLNAEMNILEVKNGIEGPFAKIQVQRNEIEGLKIDIKITMLGGEGSGKSTLIGVLISGKKDDGKGLARTNVFRHKHEILYGRTTSISQQYLGFDSKGQVTNQHKFGIPPTWAEIVEKSSKILTFIDVAGNEKYAKTMIRGICSHYPDYALILVDAKAGLTQTTIDHFKLSKAFNVPLIVVINKIDLVNSDKLNDLFLEVKELIKLQIQKISVVIKDEVEAVLISRNIQSENVCPLFMVSNKTGSGLNIFKAFLNLLPINNSSQNWEKNQEEKAEFHITETFEKDGEIILSGIVVSGEISVRQNLLLGPDNEGRFRKVEIKGIHCKRVPARQVKAGQMCSFCINLGVFAQKWLKDQGGEIRKGMVLLDTKQQPKCTFTFDAELWTFDGSTKTIKNNYQPVVHSGHIRQAARLIIEKPNQQISKRCFPSLDDYNKSNPTSSEEEKERISPALKAIKMKNKEQLSSSISPRQRKEDNQEGIHPITLVQQDKIEEIEISSNKKTKVTLQFLYYPEYLNKNSYLIINENNIKVLGRITDVYYDVINKFGSQIQKGFKGKRKNSLPSLGIEKIKIQEEQKTSSTTVEEQSFDISGSTQQNNHTRNRRVPQSQSMCIDESKEELGQQENEESKENNDQKSNDMIKKSTFQKPTKIESNQLETPNLELSQ